VILIISFEENEHVNQVRQHLSGDSAIVNTEWFPTSLAVDARFGVDGERMTLTLPGGRRLSLDEVHAVWNRRLRSLQVHKEVTDETARLFAWSESNEALQGIWQSMQHCYWMNSLQADEIAQRKIRQLQVDVAACDLPEEVSGPLMEPMGVFDLQFGAIDLRRTPEGEYVFFEVNPAGEYLFISQRTGPPIPQAIAAALERPRRQRR
jgi:hypothetical protein